MNENSATVSMEDLLGDIQRITLFLDANGGGHGEHGNALLSLRHPSLSLFEGEIDVFIVYPQTDDDRWGAGWIGGGDFTGTWLEDRDGRIIDPWLDERVRGVPNAETTEMEHIPVVCRIRDHSEPLGYLHQAGKTIEPTEHQKDLCGRYEEWLSSGEGEKVVPTRRRVLLSDAGLGGIAQTSRWAQAVISADQRGIPPTRARRQIEAKRTPPARDPAPVDERSIEERVAAMTGRPISAEQRRRQEKRDMAMEAINTLSTKQPLSWKKVIVAIGLGLASGWMIVLLFG